MKYVKWFVRIPILTLFLPLFIIDIVLGLIRWSFNGHFFEQTQISYWEQWTP